MSENLISLKNNKNITRNEFNLCLSLKMEIVGTGFSQNFLLIYENNYKEFWNLIY